jgi:hypothetical protein
MKSTSSPTHGLSVFHHILPRHLRTPTIRSSEGGQDAHRSRFARAVRAEDAQDRSFLRCQVYPVQSVGFAIGSLLPIGGGFCNTL